MILATAIGYALQRFAGLPDAMIFGMLIGLVVAPLVPSAAACTLPRRTDASGRPNER